MGCDDLPGIVEADHVLSLPVLLKARDCLVHWRVLSKTAICIFYVEVLNKIIRQNFFCLSGITFLEVA
jgi:hypothetical protein